MPCRRCCLAVVLGVMLSSSRGIDADDRPAGLPDGAEPWGELQLSEGKAYRAPGGVYVAFDAQPPASIQIPRLANRLLAAHWLGDPQRRPLPVKPHPDVWSLSLSPPPADVENNPPIVVLSVDGEPARAGIPRVISPAESGELRLSAHLATTNGLALRYEPQPHKDTLGYWTNPEDWAEWRIEIREPGTHVVDILQGCGAGQGGSHVDLILKPEAGGEALVLPYTPVETGHFQNFRWQLAGSIALPKAGPYRVQLRPRRLAHKAVMDLREIRIRPAARVMQPPPPPARPSVLIFFTDDQGTLDAGCYGSRDLFTPYMDGLAHDGVRLTQAYAHTVCCPARALLITGRHPQRSGVNDWMQGEIDHEPTDRQGRNMALAEITLAEHLSAHGYRTALCGKWHLGADRDHGPTRQGFDEFFGLRNGFIDNTNHYFLHRDGYHDLYRGTDEIWHPGEYFPDLMTDEAERFLEQHAQQNTDRPFFLYVAFNIPHYPEQGDPRFDQQYASTPQPRRSYGRMISTADDRMGRVLAKLDEFGWRDDTIILWMSDNGHSVEEYEISRDEHASGYARGHRYGANGGGGNTGPWIGHKGTFYEGGLRVPAVICFPPRLPRGVVREQIVTAADWYPTICDLCGLKPPDGVTLDGASLVPILTENAATHHAALHWQWQDQWCVREGEWKLIHLRKESLLVNLAEEQAETVNHAAAHPEIVARFTRLHESWAQEVMPPP